jgi:carboxymethylenebutenolidase
MTITAEKTIEIAGVPHYLARSTVPTTAGVLLLPHVYGVDEFVREFADELAARGLTTLAWNPYPSLPMGASFTERPEKPTDENAMKLLGNCLDMMGSELGLSTVGTIGFCMGGRYALLFGARDARVRAVVASYPSIPAQRGKGQDMEPVPAAGAIACPVQVLYPGRDTVTPRPVFEALQAMLQGRPAPTTVLLYPNAEHGFMHATGPENDAATKLARPQVYTFLETHLKGE